MRAKVWIEPLFVHQLGAAGQLNQRLCPCNPGLINRSRSAAGNRPNNCYSSLYQPCDRCSSQHTVPGFCSAAPTLPPLPSSSLLPLSPYRTCRR